MLNSLPHMESGTPVGLPRLRQGEMAIISHFGHDPWPGADARSRRWCEGALKNWTKKNMQQLTIGEAEMLVLTLTKRLDSSSLFVFRSKSR